ncbi:hypothetical protein NQU17_02380 [Clostridiaceae bacterium HFYG-1003]|nr:hypothetical protein NQU17_02380 [Clostridiaceae bacterium HFYG-1003]
MPEKNNEQRKDDGILGLLLGLLLIALPYIVFYGIGFSMGMI